MPISPTTFWLSQIVLSWNYLWFPLLRQLPKRMLGKVTEQFFSFSFVSPHPLVRVCCSACFRSDSVSPFLHTSFISKPSGAELINWLHMQFYFNAEWRKPQPQFHINSGPHARIVFGAFGSSGAKWEGGRSWINRGGKHAKAMGTHLGTPVRPLKCSCILILKHLCINIKFPRFTSQLIDLIANRHIPDDKLLLVERVLIERVLIVAGTEPF